jgi:hypothetical protein
MVVRAAALCAAVAVGAGAWGQCEPVETRVLRASDGDSFDRFGIFVDIDADTCVSGAYLDEPAGAGSAYVFERAGGVWEETAKLTAPDAGGWFGVSVSVSGDLVLVGAQLSDAAAQDAGAAYVFRRDGGWVWEATLTGSEAAPFDWLGHAVAIDGDVAIASAHLDDGVAEDAGAAYVFRRVEGAWAEEARLTASDGSFEDEFGTSVDVRGSLAIVGARFADQLGSNAGAAYVFRLVEGVWVEEAVLLADDGGAGDEFGFSVSIDGDRALVGARLDDDAGVNAGAAYVFERDGGVWSRTAKLVAGATSADDRLGESVSLEGELALLGARQHDGAGEDAGAAFLFRHDGDGWVEEATLIGSETEAGHFFGISVALSETDAIAGANLDDVGGDQAGSATVFELGCAGCAADCDGSGGLDVLDFVCFQNEWTAQTPTGDCNGDGSHDVLDFVCFQGVFVAGCG